MARKRIGELLLERGAISPAQLEAALTAQPQTRQRLGAILVEQGALDEATLSRVLAEALAIPEVDLTAVQPDWSAVHSLRASFCEQHELFPFALAPARGGKLLLVAMADPLDVAAIDEIEFTTGVKVSPRLAPRSAVRAAILRYYHKAPVPAVVGRGARPGGSLEEEEVIVGEPLVEEEPLGDVLPGRPPPEAGRDLGGDLSSGLGGDVAAELSRDLHFLLKLREEGEPVEALERKFWALLRLLARKGLITAEEFTRELDGEG